MTSTVRLVRGDALGAQFAQELDEQQRVPLGAIPRRIREAFGRTRAEHLLRQPRGRDA